MDLWEIVVVTIRRWKVTLPVAALGLVVLLVVASGVAPTYKAKSGIGFLSGSGTLEASADDPSDVQVGSLTNPFSAGDSRNMARYAQTAAASKPAQIALGENGVSSDYEVLLDNFYPVITIEAEAATPEAALETNQFLFELISSNVAGWQQDAGIDEDSTLRQRTQLLFADEEASQDTTSRTKVLLLGTVALLLVTCGSGILADLVAYRRNRATRPVLATASAGATTVPQEWVNAAQPSPAVWNEAEEVLTEPGERVGAGSETSRWGRR